MGEALVDRVKDNLAWSEFRHSKPGLAFDDADMTAVQEATRLISSQRIELARLRAEVARLIAAWPSGDVDNESHRTPKSVVCMHGTWLVVAAGTFEPRIPLAHLSREAAVRAAVGLDAGDAKVGE
jgi:hypothetical protein